LLITNGGNGNLPGGTSQVLWDWLLEGAA